MSNPDPGLYKSLFEVQIEVFFFPLFKKINNFDYF